jgi:hypothetical protein
MCSYLHTLNVMNLVQLLSLYIYTPNRVRIRFHSRHGIRARARSLFLPLTGSQPSVYLYLHPLPPAIPLLAALSLSHLLAGAPSRVSSRPPHGPPPPCTTRARRASPSLICSPARRPGSQLFFLLLF